MRLAISTPVVTGVTILSARLVHHSLGHYLEQLEALQQLAGTGTEAA